MSKKIKLTLLWLARISGVFAICHYFYRYHVRVLCYHGFAYLDEHQFRPKLFMRPDTFAARLNYLARSQYRIVSLSEALANPQRERQLVLTMDDGWAGTAELVGQTLQQHQFPLMLYVTSYYADKQIPVLNVAVSYLLWKTRQPSIKVALPGQPVITAALPATKPAELVDRICDQIDALPNVTQRAEVLYQIADQLGVSLYHFGKQLFRMLNTDEIKTLQKFNVELQLHTHRHCSPLNKSSFAEEIKLNREWLAQFTAPAQLIHFCYPNGEYQQMHFTLLKSNGITTAMTTHSGLYRPGSDLLQICRVLDGEDVHWLELEAELCGFSSFLRPLIGVSI